MNCPNCGRVGTMVASMGYAVYCCDYCIRQHETRYLRNNWQRRLKQRIRKRTVTSTKRTTLYEFKDR